MGSVPRLNKPKEKEIQKAILEYLALRGVCCWRNNTGGWKDSRGHFYQFGSVGSGDILGLTSEGRFFSIEVKAFGKHPSPHQVKFIEKINRNKGIAFVAYSIDDIDKYLLDLN